MGNCLAAKHNPANACADKCKWPNACKQTSITVVETVTIESPAVTEDPAAEAPAEKPKRSKKTK